MVTTQRLAKLKSSIPRAMAGTDLPADPDPLESGIPDAVGKALKDNTVNTPSRKFLTRCRATCDHHYHP